MLDCADEEPPPPPFYRDHSRSIGNRWVGEGYLNPLRPACSAVSAE